MIWSIRQGDIIHFPKDIYHYEVIETSPSGTLLEQCLTKKSCKISTLLIQNEAKIIRRTD